MKTKWLVVAAVLLMIGGAALLLLKEKRPAAVAGGASVVLVADMGEADAPCGCGDIIRAVRAAAKRGVPTREIDPDKTPALVAEYHASPPSVIVLDARGAELRRFEGESQDTVAAVRSALEAMPPTVR